MRTLELVLGLVKFHSMLVADHQLVLVMEQYYLYQLVKVLMELVLGFLPLVLVLVVHSANQHFPILLQKIQLQQELL
jgi:hypothetical protein